MLAFADPLPIDSALPDLLEALRAKTRAVLVAPPGAGKTTRVPLALMDEPCGEAARSSCSSRAGSPRAPRRSAWPATLGEKVGETVGLRVRLQSLVSTRTRIEVVTEGVFARMILDDPSLEGVAAVLFDEFHERSLDADLGLALALDAQSGCARTCGSSSCRRRSTARASPRCCDGAARIESAGRAFPVETRYLGRDPGAAHRGRP